MGRRLVPTSTELGAIVMVHAAVRLGSVDPVVNRFRVDVLSWQSTLWGDVALVQTWGRLDRPGRSRTTSSPSRAGTQGMMVRLLSPEEEMDDATWTCDRFELKPFEQVVVVFPETLAFACVKWSNRDVHFVN